MIPKIYATLRVNNVSGSSLARSLWYKIGSETTGEEPWEIAASCFYSVLLACIEFGPMNQKEETIKQFDKMTKEIEQLKTAYLAEWERTHVDNNKPA